jgi:uncharacterized membrane protein
MLSNNHYFEGARNNTGAGGFALFTRRINSFNVRVCGFVFTSLALVALLVAVVFAVLGAWLILPFAGLEAVALYLAFSWIARHAGDSELLEIRGNAVVLVVTERAHTRQYEFNCAWAQLVVDGHANGMRLALRSHGREIEVGRYLDGSGRRLLAQTLRDRLQAR